MSRVLYTIHVKFKQMHKLKRKFIFYYLNIHKQRPYVYSSYHKFIIQGQDLHLLKYLLFKF